MKAEDLMIGDWVLFAGSKYQIHKEDYSANYVFEPIQLTSEILEKNGFKRLQDTYLFNIATNQFGVNLWLEIGPDSWIENNKICVDSLKGDFNYPILTIMSCKYVHKFQHLLKLFGIKKDIKI